MYLIMPKKENKEYVHFKFFNPIHFYRIEKVQLCEI